MRPRQAAGGSREHRAASGYSRETIQACAGDVSAAVDEFREHLRANDYSANTVRAYASDLSGLVAFCAERSLLPGQLDASALSEFLLSDHALRGPTGHQRGPGAINRVRATLRSFFGWLRDTGHMAANPAACLRTSSYHAPMPGTISQDDEHCLLGVMSDASGPLALRDRTMVEVLLASGMRVSELVGSRIADLDLDARTIVIRVKGGAAQTRYLRTRALQVLKSYLRGRAAPLSPGEPLFTRASGGRLTARHFRRRLHEWVRRAGLAKRVTPHTFRHTLATRLLSRTGNLRLVQQALGHRSIASTVRYARVPSEALKDALERV